MRLKTNHFNPKPSQRRIPCSSNCLVKAKPRDHLRYRRRRLGLSLRPMASACIPKTKKTTTKAHDLIGPSIEQLEQEPPASYFTVDCIANTFGADVNARLG